MKTLLLLFMLSPITTHAHDPMSGRKYMPPRVVRYMIEAQDKGEEIDPAPYCVNAYNSGGSIIKQSCDHWLVSRCTWVADDLNRHSTKGVFFRCKVNK